jgi:hypothetical protein
VAHGKLVFSNAVSYQLQVRTSWHWYKTSSPPERTPAARTSEGQYSVSPGSVTERREYLPQDEGGRGVLPLKSRAVVVLKPEAGRKI